MSLDLTALSPLVAIVAVAGLYWFTATHRYRWITHWYEPLEKFSVLSLVLGVGVGAGLYATISSPWAALAVAPTATVMVMATWSDVAERRVPAPPLWLAFLLGLIGFYAAGGSVIVLGIALVIALMYFVFALVGVAGPSDYRMLAAVAPSVGLMDFDGALVYLGVFALGYVVCAVVARIRKVGIPVALPVTVALGAGLLFALFS